MRTAYDWDPGAHLAGVPETAVLGVEAPLWSETVNRIDQVEFMYVPHCPRLAEVAWSPQSAREWNDFRQRLANHGPRWEAMSVTFCRSPQIPWPLNPNLALGRPVTVSSTEVAQFPGSAAVDGNPTTRWSSGYSDPQWISIDLGSSPSIRRLVLNWETAYTKSYQVQMSDDGARWRDIYSTTTANGGINTLFVDGTGRFLRVYTTERATNWGVSLWDLDIRLVTRSESRPTAGHAARDATIGGPLPRVRRHWVRHLDGRNCAKGGSIVRGERARWRPAGHRRLSTPHATALVCARPASTCPAGLCGCERPSGGEPDLRRRGFDHFANDDRESAA